MCVLILVLMDDALVRVNNAVENKENKVLILVLMDDALVLKPESYTKDGKSVS